MGNFKISASAVRWALRIISYKGFKEILDNCHQYRMMINRGGFQVNSGSFREPGTTQRLVSVICKDADFGRMLMMAAFSDEARHPGLAAAYSMLDARWVRANWRKLFRAVRDPRYLAMCFFSDSAHGGLHRIGELLALCEQFWRDGGVQPRAGAASRRDGALLPAGLNYLSPRMPLDTAGKCAGSAAAAETPDGMPPKPALLPPENSAGKGGAILPLVPSSAAAGGDGVPAAGEAKTRSLKEELNRLRKQLRDEKKNGEEQLRSVNEALKKCKKERDELEKRLDAAAQNLDGAMAELQREKEREVQEEVDDFKMAVLGMNPDFERRAADSRARSEQLETRIKKAMERQREIDAICRTRSELRAESERLNRWAVEIRQMCDDAVRVDEEMLSLQTEVEVLLKKIDDDLRGETADEGVVLAQMPSRLVSYVKEVPPGDRAAASKVYNEVEQWLDSDMGKRIIAPSEKEQLSNIIAGQRNKLRHAEEVERNRVIRSQTKPLFNLPRIGELWQHIGELREIELSVDAYNAIKRDSYFHGRESEVQGFQRAREEFIALCREVAPRFRHITLYFDTDLIAENIEHCTDHLTLVWVAKRTEDQNADNRMLEELCRNADADKDENAWKRRWVVTDDIKLTQQLEREECCGATVKTSTFVRQLKMLKKTLG